MNKSEYEAQFADVLRQLFRNIEGYAGTEPDMLAIEDAVTRYAAYAYTEGWIAHKQLEPVTREVIVPLLLKLNDIRKLAVAVQNQQPGHSVMAYFDLGNDIFRIIEDCERLLGVDEDE